MSGKRQEGQGWPAANVEMRAVASLIPNPKNARRHSDEQVAQIARSIEEFGFARPLLVDEAGMLIAGHGTLRAAKLLKIAEVPTMTARGWSEDQKRAYALADNKIAANSEWDEDLLREDLEKLSIDGFDPGLTGFSEREIAKLLNVDGEASITVVERQATSPVLDRFWISVRGPLASQAEALTKLRGVMAELPHVEVELGTTPVD